MDAPGTVALGVTAPGLVKNSGLATSRGPFGGPGTDWLGKSPGKFRAKSGGRWYDVAQAEFLTNQTLKVSFWVSRNAYLIDFTLIPVYRLHPFLALRWRRSSFPSCFVISQCYLGIFLRSDFYGDGIGC